MEVLKSLHKHTPIKTDQFTKVSGREDSDTVKECSPGLMALDTKDSGRRTKFLAKGSSTTWMGQSMMENGLIT